MREMPRRSTPNLLLCLQIVIASAACVRAVQHHQHCEAQSDGITQCGRSHRSHTTRGSNSGTSYNQRLTATAIAAAGTDGRPILVDLAATAATAAARRGSGDGVRVSPRNTRFFPHAPYTPRERCTKAEGAPGWGIMSDCDSSNIISNHRGSAAATPLRLRVRGGASTEVGESSDSSASSKGPTARAGDKTTGTRRLKAGGGLGEQGGVGGQGMGVVGA